MPEALFERWLQTARAAGGRVLLRRAADGKEWTAGDLLARVEYLDGFLPESQSWRGGLIAISQPDAVEWLCTFLLCLKRGAVPVSLDTDLPLAGFERVMRELRPAVALMGNDSRIFSDSPPPPQAAAVAKLTVGIQGQHRPIFFTLHEIEADWQRICQAMEITNRDINFAMLPLGTSYGFGNLVLPLIFDGVGMVLGSAAFPRSLADEISATRPSLLPLVPTLLRALVRANVPSECLRSLRLLISAGDTLDPGLVRACAEKFGLAPSNFFGATETGAICFDPESRATVVGTSLGKPMRGVEVCVGPDQRLVVQSDAVFSIGNPEAREGVGAQRLADFGRVLADGSVALEGRCGELMKIGGRRFHPSEVELVVSAIPGVREMGITSFCDEHGETRCLLRYAGPHTPRELRALLREELPGWKIPHRIIKDSGTE